MPRVNRVQRTPESGYKFVCQSCEDEVVQVPPPELVFAFERVRGTTQTQAMQCCIDCAEEIKKTNEKYGKKYPQSVRQVRELRPESELPPDVQALKAEQRKAASADGKIDKLCDTVDKLATLMTQFLTYQIQKEAPPVMAPVQLPLESGVEIMPGMLHAKSTSPKPKTKRAAKAQTKRKSS